MSADTALMPIPGPADPVPVPRAATARADGRVELIGLGRDAMRTALEEAGLELKQAKLRAKQIWHWIYNRGVTDFDAQYQRALLQVSNDAGMGVLLGAKSTPTFFINNTRIAGMVPPPVFEALIELELKRAK